MEPLLVINVVCHAQTEVKGSRQTVVMVPFECTAESHLFSGKIIGTGYDMQKHLPDGSFILSAGYMLEGVDSDGQPCRIYIENETREDGVVRPVITTDSKRLGFLEHEKMYSEITPVEGGVTIRIFTELGEKKADSLL